MLTLSAVVIWNINRPKEVTNLAWEFEEEQTREEKEKQAGGVQEGIQIPGYQEIVIPAGVRDVEVELTNPEENEVYFQISLCLAETEEILYQSKLIKPGQTIYQIQLEREMEAGEYPLVVQYATYRETEETFTPRNGAQVRCNLVVTNS
jgi:hypothetical protein